MDSIAHTRPQAREVPMEIRATSINFPNLLIVEHKHQMKPPLPFVPGSEYAGVVQAVGAGKGPDVFYDPVGEPLV